MDNTTESILLSVKKMLGLEPDYEAFDVDIIMHINSVFMILNQLGIGPDEPFTIQDKYALWYDFLEDTRIEAVKTLMYMRVRVMFDPPTSSYVLESLNKQIEELEWRLNVSEDKMLNGK